MTSGAGGFAPATAPGPLGCATAGPVHARVRAARAAPTRRRRRRTEWVAADARDSGATTAGITITRRPAWVGKFVRLFTQSIYKWVQAPLSLHIGNLDLERERALQLPVVESTEWTRSR